jgi:MFS family permease
MSGFETLASHSGFHLSTVINDRLHDVSDSEHLQNNISDGRSSSNGSSSSCGGATVPPPPIMASVYSVIAFASIAARIFSGFLIDRVAPRIVLALALLLQAAALAFVPLVRTTGAILVVCTVQGISQAIFSSVGNVVYAAFFGRTHLGSISGAGKSLVVLGSALGPFPFGLARDLTGSFDVAFEASALLSIIFMVLALRYGRAPSKGVDHTSSAGCRSASGSGRDQAQDSTQSHTRESVELRSVLHPRS